MRTFLQKFQLFLALVAVCLTVAITFAVVLYSDEGASPGRLTFVIVCAVLLSIVSTVALMVAGSAMVWAYRRRRRPLAWLAIQVLAAATKEPVTFVEASGILSRDGNLLVSLPRRQSDSIADGDSFIAVRLQDQKHLGIVTVIRVQDYHYLCEVTDRMDAQDFWNGLELRMASDFSPPAGVGFSRHIDQIDADSIRRLIRSWGG